MVNVEAINKERLKRWEVKCNRHHATPVFLLAIGHDHNLGKINVLTTEDRTDQELLLFLKQAVESLQQLIDSKN